MPALFDRTSTTLIQSSLHAPHALQQLCEIYFPLVYHWARQLNLQAVDAEDVAQTVFTSIQNRLQRYDRSKGGFRAWLYGVTRNCVRDHQRAQGKLELQLNSDAIAELPKDAKSEHLPPIIAKRAIQVLEGLFDDTTQAILIDLIVNDRPANEVAAEYNKSLTNIYTIKSRSLLKLREILGEATDETLPVS